MAELKAGTTIGGYRQLHEGIDNPKLSSTLTIEGDIIIKNGQDLHLRATSGSADSGDIIFENGDGDEIARVWQEAGQIKVRFNGGTAYTVWHSGNDGSGSGLDADKLDGYHASSFVKTSDYEDSDVLAKIKNVDGSGSGLDADMIDGVHASQIFTFNYNKGSLWTPSIASSNGWNRVGGFHGAAGDCYISLGSSSGKLHLIVDGEVYANEGRYQCWNSGNVSLNTSSSGYLKLPNGLIIQWVSVSCGGSVDYNTSVNFPTSFPNACLKAVVSTRANTTNNMDAFARVRSWNSSTVYLRLENTYGGKTYNPTYIDVIALGY